MRVAPAPTNAGRRSHTLATHVQGRWRLFARGVWLVLVVLTLAIFGASFPVYLAQLQTPCPECAYGFRLTPSQVGVLKGMGLSTGDYAASMVALTLALVVVCLGVSTLIAWRRPHDRMALLVALMLVTFGPVIATSSVALSPSPWHLPNECLTFLAFALVVLVFLLFPSGQFVPSWTRWTFVVFLVGQVPLTFFPDAPIPLIPYASLVGFLMLLGELAIVVVVQLYRYRRVSSPLERQQTKWVVFGLALPIAVFVSGTLLPLPFPALADPNASSGASYQLALNAISSFTGLLIPLSFGFAMLRSRLWEIDSIINRTLVYGLLTAIVVGVYVLVVGLLGTLLHASGNALIALLATGVVAVLFQPLRARLQRVVNRLVYGERDEPYAVLSRLLHRLEATLERDRVLSTIVETVAQALKLPYAAITVKQGEVFTPAATFGLPQDTPFLLPLVYHSETIGQLLLAPRAPGDAFTAADWRLLEDLARQAGVAVHAVRLTADLQRSREQLVATREEERRRLRRDLHDGLGPSLASLTFKVDAARNLLTKDSARAETLLAEVRQQAQQAITDIRRLVYNLRPPALDELGLLSALREQAALYQHQGLAVTFDTPSSLLPLPAAVEVAIYRIAQEALTNVARHAEAQRCLLRLSIKDDTLSLDIADDGKGIPASHPIGIGLHAMHERASELGGSCVVTPGASGGTLIQVRLPLPREQESIPPAASNESHAGHLEEEKRRSYGADSYSDC